MLILNQHPLNKSITASIIGRPNAGKSTLVNCLLGYDLSIVSPKPQTTRNHFQCVFHIDRTEVILVDTPGIHFSNQEINKRMNHEAFKAQDRGDMNLVLIDSSVKNMHKEWDLFKKATRDMQFAKVLLVFTKMDTGIHSEKDCIAFFEQVKEDAPNIEIVNYLCLSAKKGKNIQLLKDVFKANSYSSPHYFTDGEVSNKNLRFFVSEYIREQVYHLLSDELPYEVAVMIDFFKELPPREGEDPEKICAKIGASILVNRTSQRAIVVGSGGKVIKQIGMRARKKIEALIGGKVMLNLHVKVSSRWFNNNRVLEELGLERSPQSTRVWRQQ
jgi:GTP-binding protein Era